MSLGIATLNLDAWRAQGVVRDGLFVARGGPETGEVVLCLHGFPTSSLDWQLVWDTLTEAHHAIAPDMLGYGDSQKPKDGDYTVMAHADRTEVLMMALGVTQCWVLAHDLGATVAQELMARQLEGRLGFHISRLCLLNSGLFPETHRPRLVQRALLSPVGPLIARAISRRVFGRAFSAVFGPDTQPTEQEIDTLYALIEREGGMKLYPKHIRYMRERKTHRDRWVGALERSDVPTRFICGVRDPVSGQHAMDRYRELIPQPDTVPLEVGHYPQLEAPSATIEAALALFDASAH